MIIVVGVDDSAQATTVLRRAAAEAERWGAELHVVHVVDVPAALGEAMWQMPGLGEEFARARRDSVWGRLEPVLAVIPGEVSRVDLDGYPGDALVRYSEKVGAELLVLGTRGRGDIASLVLGSTSHRALHIATCDVLVVRRTEGEPSEEET